MFLPPSQLTLSPSLHLISASNDRTIQVFRVDTGALVKKWEDSTVESLSLSTQHLQMNKGRTLAISANVKENTPYVCSAADDGKLKVWLYDQTEPVVVLDSQDKW